MRALAIATVLAVTRIALGDPSPPVAPHPSPPAPPPAAPPDTAGTAAPSAASAAFQRGRELARLGRFAEACAELTRSYDLDPALGTAVNLADCLEREGQITRAWALFDLVARSSQGLPSRARFARERADALAARFPTAVIAAPEPATATRRRRPYLYVAAGLAAAGAVGLGSSLVLGLEARSAYRDALARDCAATNIVDDAGYAACRARVDRAGVRADHATGFALAGAVLGAAAAAVFVTAPREQVQLAPIASSRALGLGISGRF